MYFLVEIYVIAMILENRFGVLCLWDENLRVLLRMLRSFGSLVYRTLSNCCVGSNLDSSEICNGKICTEICYWYSFPRFLEEIIIIFFTPILCAFRLKLLRHIDIGGSKVRVLMAIVRVFLMNPSI